MRTTPLPTPVPLSELTASESEALEHETPSYPSYPPLGDSFYNQLSIIEEDPANDPSADTDPSSFTIGGTYATRLGPVVVRENYPDGDVQVTYPEDPHPDQPWTLHKNDIHTLPEADQALLDPALTVPQWQELVNDDLWVGPPPQSFIDPSQSTAFAGYTCLTHDDTPPLTPITPSPKDNISALWAGPCALIGELALPCHNDFLTSFTDSDTNNSGFDYNHGTPMPIYNVNNRNYQAVAYAASADSHDRDIPRVGVTLVEDIKLPRFDFQVHNHPLEGMIMESMVVEYQALMNMGAWGIAISPPPDAQVVDTMWVFRANGDEFGRLVKIKARLTMRGDQMKDWFEGSDAYSPVKQMTTVRLLMSTHAADLDVHFVQMDVTAAYLTAKMKNAVYIRMPKGFQTAKLCPPL